MQFVVLPLFTEWARFSRTALSRKMLGNIGHNKAAWDAVVAEAEAEAEAARNQEREEERLQQKAQEQVRTYWNYPRTRRTRLFLQFG